VTIRWSDPDFGQLIAQVVQDPKCAHALSTMKIAFVLGVLRVLHHELASPQGEDEDFNQIGEVTDCWREWLDNLPLPCKCGTCYRVANVAHRKGLQTRIRYEDLPKNPTPLRVRELIESWINQGIVMMLPELTKFWDNSMEGLWQTSSTGSSPGRK
jgi:hypothetical protein